MKTNNHRLKSKLWVIRIAVLFVVILCMGIFIPWNAVLLWIRPLPATLQEEVKNAIRYDLDGIVLFVGKKDQAAEFYTAGYNDRALKIPANPEALFKIASISKLYIAAAAAKLISDSTLSPDKSLSSYLPDVARKIENADQITLRMLLQHRSGIPDFINSPDLPWSNLPQDAGEFLKLSLNKPSDFKPGSKTEYSNTNYLLIAYIIDKVLGYSHRDYIAAHIFKPLQLKHTHGLLRNVDMNNMMSGYYVGYEGDLKTQDYVCPGGSMVATAEDVSIFLRALNDGTLLNSHEQAIYTEMYKYDHTGSLPGYSSFAYYYKDIDAVVVLFVNTSGDNTWTTSELLFNRLVKILRKSP